MAKTEITAETLNLSISKTVKQQLITTYVKQIEQSLNIPHQENTPVPDDITASIPQIHDKLTSILQQPKIAKLSTNYYQKSVRKRQEIIVRLTALRQQIMQLVQIEQSTDFSALPDCHDPQTEKLLLILLGK